MRTARLFLCCLILGQSAGPAFAANGFSIAAPAGPASVPAVPVLQPGYSAGAALQRPSFGALTGALTRRLKDPGPIRRMWFVYASDEQRRRSAEALELIRADNPGLEIAFLHADEVLPQGAGREGRKALYARIVADKAEFVLAADQDLYERFRNLRDVDLARNLPFGYAGRRFISVDIPRASLDPRRLSDPLRYSHRNYLVLSAHGGAPAEAAGMSGKRLALRQLLRAAELAGHGAAKKDEDLNFAERQGLKALMHLTGQADDRATARRRARAHKLAAALDREETDVLVTDDPEAARTVALMKRMGYHKSLPVVWKGAQEAPDASGISFSAPAGAPLADALARAKALPRLPENFMEMGGVSVRDFEPKVREVLARALPGRRAPDSRGPRYDIHFMLTNGNGIRRKGDSNPFGHFAMAVTDEKKRTLVWTVQYNDGGSFTGGLGPGQQMTLPEYLYGLWYLPGAAGQALPQGETAGATTYDFVLRGAVDQAGLEAMRRVAADINARHMKGEDNYSLLNKHGATNCISLVTQLLRAAGFAIAESGIQAPADKAVEMIAGLARRLLSHEAAPVDLGLVVFERPAHAGTAHYRIANTALGSPFFNRKKTWRYMSLSEKTWRVLTWLPTLMRSFRIHQTMEAFAAMATQRVVVGPNSRELQILDTPQSPIARLREAAGRVERLRRQRVALEAGLARLQERVLASGQLPGALRKRYHQLEMRLALNLFDEQIAQRTVEFHKVEVADPLGRYAKRLKALRAASRDVLALRARMEAEDRVLEPGELEGLDRLNSKVETELAKIQLDILRRLGPRVPHDMRQVSRQVTLQTLDELLGREKKEQEAAARRAAFRTDSVTTYPSAKTPAMDARVKVVGDPQEGFLAKVMMIRAAKRTIDMSTYIFKPDAIGYAILGELRRAAERGVRVRLMVDSLGSLGLTHSELKAILKPSKRGAGSVEVTVFNSVFNPPVIWEMLRRKVRNLFTRDDHDLGDIFRWRNRRSHDKILLVDREDPRAALAMLGGRNIAEHYYGLPRVTPDTFNDMEILIRSQGLDASLGAHFDRLFAHLGNKGLAPNRSLKTEVAETSQMARNQRALLVDSAATAAKLAAMEAGEYLKKGFNAASAEFVNEIQNITRRRALLDPDSRLNRPNGDSIVENFRAEVLAAKKSIVFVSPYFWLEKDEIARLKEWLDQDPERTLTILSNSIMTTDNIPAQALVDHYLGRRLLRDPAWKGREGQVKLFAFGRLDSQDLGGDAFYGKLHAKYAIVDGKTGLVTTSNADPRSRNLNSEVGFIFRGEAVGSLQRAADDLAARSTQWGSADWEALRARFPVKCTLERLLAFWFRRTLFSRRLV